MQPDHATETECSSVIVIDSCALKEQTDMKRQRDRSDKQKRFSRRRRALAVWAGRKLRSEQRVLDFQGDWAVGAAKRTNCRTAQRAHRESKRAKQLQRSKAELQTFLDASRAFAERAETGATWSDTEVYERIADLGIVDKRAYLEDGDVASVSNFSSECSDRRDWVGLIGHVVPTPNAVRELSDRLPFDGCACVSIGAGLALFEHLLAETSCNEVSCSRLALL